MLYNIIKSKKNEWLNSNECKVTSIFEYIKSVGKLREAQIEAIEIYLYLKIKCENKPLWKLFSEGVFNYELNLENLRISQNARDLFNQNIAAKSLFLLATSKNGTTKSLMPELEESILTNLDNLDYISIIKEMFYGINYTDYLFSLPMGAGKTFLMASIAYLDLYFAINEPENKLFAHNFLILIPSGLKTSIIPSLKSIEKFDPTWVIPEPAASHIKSIIKFEVLDEPKAKKKSTQTTNPNVQKINQYQPFEDIMGLFLIVNAEKVILDHLKVGNLYSEIEDERDQQANELRNKLGKIPNLQIHIDEYHHLVSSTILLRQVVTKWNGTVEQPGNINSVLGFSGTPYNDEKISLTDNLKIKFHQITNTIYYFPLITAIQQFLKKPKTITYHGVDQQYIIKNGVTEFLNEYGTTVYKDGTCAKLAIYCGTIENMENVIYPYLIGGLNIPETEILRFHKGNKEFSIHPNSEIEFAYLDTPSSKIKIILLVQVGKEGWDCRSLTGVILSNKGACPTNMVLQTSCRCLRQIETIDNQKPTAKIWLNTENAAILDKQLKDEQNTNIDEFNKVALYSNLVERHSRLEKLNNPKFNFLQFNITYDIKILEENKEVKDKIQEILENLNNNNNFINYASREDANFDQTTNKKQIINNIQGSIANFDLWLYKISKDSFNFIKYVDLLKHKDLLYHIFQQIIIQINNEIYFNDLYNINEIESQIRVAFHQLRYIEEKEEIIPDTAKMLIVEKLKAVEDNPLLYPKKETTIHILDSDKNIDVIAKLQEAQENLKSLGFGHLMQNIDIEPVFYHKDKTFQYIPYNFKQSKFELTILENILNLDTLSQLNLEIFYNGEKELSDFRIDCYKKNSSNNRWKRVGLYTPDFLIIKRENNNIDKVLILETKGSGFAEQSSFIDRIEFVKAEFLKLNNENKLENNIIPSFEFLYIEDSNSIEQNINKINNSITNFFSKQLN